MSEAEIKRKFDEIVDFADIGKFLDTPVAHYSSGMYARLGFAVAVHVDADIFLADEVLAVGDRPFKKKCMAKMQEIRQQGTTIFYVSHAAGSVAGMCDRVLVLESGHLLRLRRRASTRASATCTTTTTTTRRARTPTRSSAPTSEPTPGRRSMPSDQLRWHRSSFNAIHPCNSTNYRFVIRAESLARIHVTGVTLGTRVNTSPSHGVP